MSAIAPLLKRDLKLAVRDGGALGTALGFNLLVVTLLPLGLGPDLALLGRIAPGVLWIALLLSALLSLPRMFEADLEDGSLEVMAASGLSLEGVVAAKGVVHWLTACLPLTLLAPVLGLLLNLDLATVPILLATLLLGFLDLAIRLALLRLIGCFQLLDFLRHRVGVHRGDVHHLPVAGRGGRDFAHRPVETDEAHHHDRRVHK